MKKFIVALCTLGLLGLAAESWAGPVEEVAQIAAPRSKIFEEGTAEGYAAAFADNAVLTSSRHRMASPRWVTPARARTRMATAGAIREG